jgi:glyoxylase-like metal-dependent hydrolase (beta-lactamase superfamily II)
MRDDDQIVSAFPKAKYFVQRGEYEDAVRANERTRASYVKENFTPIAHVSQWEFLDGDTGLVPGVSVVVTGGHTAHHQAVKIQSEGKTAIYLGDGLRSVSLADPGVEAVDSGSGVRGEVVADFRT